MLGAVSASRCFTLLCAFAPEPVGLRRAAVPRRAGPRRRACRRRSRWSPSTPAAAGAAAATTMMMTGYHVGAVLTAAARHPRHPAARLAWMFVVGALPALVLVPLMWRYLPESAAFLRVRAGLADRRADAAPRPPTTQPVGTLFHHGLGRVDDRVLDHVVHGPAAGLRPEHVAAADHAAAGYELGAALALLLVLNVGAVIGLLFAGRVADRIGNRRSDHRLVRRRRAVPRPAQHQAAGHRRLRQRAARRRLRVQRPGAGLRLRRPRLPGRGPRRPRSAPRAASGGSARSPARSSAARCSLRAWPTRGASTSSPSSRRSAPCPSPW